MAEQGFLDAILEAPDDDVPRLVYSDWLEEHGEQARAELIRVQCELARLARDNPRRAELLQNERALLQEHEARWILVPYADGIRQQGEKPWGDLKEDSDLLESYRTGFIRGLLLHQELERLPSEDSRRPELERQWREWNQEYPLREPALAWFLPEIFREHQFQRGFVELVHVDEFDFLTCAAGLFAATLPRHLKISYGDDHGESCTNGWGDATARLLLAWLPRTSLLTLDLCGIFFAENEPINTLLRSPQMSRLTTLNLECCNLDDDSVRILAASPQLGHLRSLNLLDNAITDVAVDALLDSPFLRELRTVRLGSNTEDTISEEGYERCEERFADDFETVFEE